MLTFRTKKALRKTSWYRLQSLHCYCTDFLLFALDILKRGCAETDTTTNHCLLPSIGQGYHPSKAVHTQPTSRTYFRQHIPLSYFLKRHQSLKGYEPIFHPAPHILPLIEALQNIEFLIQRLDTQDSTTKVYYRGEAFRKQEGGRSDLMFPPIGRQSWSGIWVFRKKASRPGGECICII